MAKYDDEDKISPMIDAAFREGYGPGLTEIVDAGLFDYKSRIQVTYVADGYKRIAYRTGYFSRLPVEDIVRLTRELGRSHKALVWLELM